MEITPHMSQYIDPALFALPFNLMEKAHILTWLKKLGVPRDVIISEYLPKMACEAHESVLDYYLELHHLSRELSQKVINFDLPLKLAVRLSRLCERDQKTLVELIDIYALNGNEFKKIFEALEDLGMPKLNLHDFNDKSDLFSFVDDKRCPKLAELRKKWRHCTRGISLPSGVRIQDPISFEDANVQLKIQAKNNKEFVDKLEKLQKLDFGELFDLF